MSSASPKPPNDATAPGAPNRPSGPRAAPLFEVGAAPARASGPRPAVAPAAAPAPRASGPRPAPLPAPALVPAPVRARPPEAARKRRKRSAWPFYLAMGLILLALPVGYYALLQDGPPQSGPDAAPPGKPVELKLTRVDGAVEIRHGGGQWSPVKPGETLAPADGVRTGEGGSAILTGGDQYEVHLEAQTEVAVDELTDSISRVMLGGGMATAKVQGGGKHTFEVHARNSDAVARTRQGTFAISNNMAGTVAVGTKDGEVEFGGHGKTVIVRAGQQSVVRPGQAPSDPTTLPSSLLLKVDWPAGKVLTRPDVVITGQSEPGTLVTVQDRNAVVDSNGTFRVRLSLKDGKKKALKVTARSVGGLREDSEHVVDVDTHAPSATVQPPDWVDNPR
ncbi:MAG TPA: FecR domain-containing protein [Myxococcales bacterium]|nr:FecR domain-containing protein [Myxococcales bacterium]